MKDKNKLFVNDDFLLYGSREYRSKYKCEVTQIKKMNKIILSFLLIISSLLIGCKDINKNKDQKNVIATEKKAVSKNQDLYGTEWKEINSNNGEYFSGFPNSRTIKLTKNKFFVELMEPNVYDVDHINTKNNGYDIYIKNVDWHYSFTWIDKNKLVSKWDYIYDNKIQKEYSYLTVSLNSTFKDIKIQNKEIGSVDSEVGKLDGSWAFSTETSYASLNIKLGSGLLVVMSNQIYVVVKIEKDKNKESYYNLFYVNPDDLGPGGIKMDWKNYSKTKKIGEIKQFNENEIEFKWFGFYNEKTKRNEFDECEFNLLANGNPAQLEKL